MRLTKTPLLLVGLLAALSLSLQAAAPILTTSPAAIAFIYGADGKLPAPQVLQVASTRAGAFVTISVDPVGAADWLVITPALGGKAPVAVSLRVNPSGLAARTYWTNLKIASDGADDIFIKVTLVVKGTPPTLTSFPLSASFNYVTGAAVSPARTSISIASSGQAVSLALKSSAATWLKVSADAGVAVAGAPFNFDISIDSTVALNMTPKSYSGIITVTSSDASIKPFTIPVTLAIGQGLPAISFVYPGHFAVNSVNAVVTLLGSNFFAGGSVVRIGSSDLPPAAVTFVSSSALLVAVPASILTVPGVYAITIRNGTTVSTTPAVLEVEAPGPVIDAVANVASYGPKVAPGSIMSLFGSGFGPITLTPGVIDAGAYPLSIASTTVEFQKTGGGWVQAPLIFVRADQINAVVPFNAAPLSGITINVTVTSNGATSTPFPVAFGATDPAVFTVNGSGTGTAIVLHSSSTGTLALNAKDNPALKGTIISIYLTGGGVLNPPVADGTVILPPVSPALPPQTLVQPTVTVDGKPCAVLYSGAVVGSIAGLVQINCTIGPDHTPDSEAFVIVTYPGGQSSPPGVTIAVK